jgi:hypothetical protein
MNFTFSQRELPVYCMATTAGMEAEGLWNWGSILRCGTKHAGKLLPCTVYAF